jgi:hypothetical protein
MKFQYDWKAASCMLVLLTLWTLTTAPITFVEALDDSVSASWADWSVCSRPVVQNAGSLQFFNPSRVGQCAGYPRDCVLQLGGCVASRSSSQMSDVEGATPSWLSVLETLNGLFGFNSTSNSSQSYLPLPCVEDCLASYAACVWTAVLGTQDVESRRPSRALNGSLCVDWYDELKPLAILALTDSHEEEVDQSRANSSGLVAASCEALLCGSRPSNATSPVASCPVSLSPKEGGGPSSASYFVPEVICASPFSLFGSLELSGSSWGTVMGPTLSLADLVRNAQLQDLSALLGRQEMGAPIFVTNLSIGSLLVSWAIPNFLTLPQSVVNSTLLTLISLNDSTIDSANRSAWLQSTRTVYRERGGVGLPSLRSISWRAGLGVNLPTVLPPNNSSAPTPAPSASGGGDDLILGLERRTFIIVAVSVGAGLLVLIGMCCVCLLSIRRRRKRAIIVPIGDFDGVSGDGEGDQDLYSVAGPSTSRAHYFSPARNRSLAEVRSTSSMVDFSNRPFTSPSRKGRLVDD